MKRKDFYLAEREIEGLDKAAEKLGISTSELLRRIIDKYLEETEGNK